MTERDDKFEALMRDAARSYNVPDTDPPLDAMWASIQRDLERGIVIEDSGTRPTLVERPARKRSLIGQPWLRMAAVLMIGVTLGRFSNRLTPAAEPTPTRETVAQAPDSPPQSNVPSQYQTVMNDYLGETSALLISLPSELNAKKRNAEFASRAGELLSQTRLLMDSPATSDPAMRALFEDLEVVLAQVVRLQPNRDQIEVDMLTQALQQREVLPRLRNAVADNIAN